MVFVSKEPELFEGKVKIAILVDGEEMLSNYCHPQEADKIAINAIGSIILGFTRYLLKQAPSPIHPDITQLRQKIKSSKAPYKVIAANLAVIRKHLPGGRLKHACQNKLRQLEELISCRKEMEDSTQAIRT